MDKETALSEVKKRLPEKRYAHTLRVMECAVELAKRYGADPAKAELASALHDIAKYFPEEEMRAIIQSRETLPDLLLDYHPSVWHAPVGAIYIKETFGLTDPDILAAITYHTTGRSGMSVLEKVVFLADYIEPGRSFPGVDEVREMAKEDLDLAVAQALANTVRFLVENYSQVYPDTLSAYNDLIQVCGVRLKEWHKRTEV
ncbi:bis(5'-nucleosyl)-tetraphosphatase (symmetrical) YqeK [Tuberibacillus calidus]|jgi:predicted HD superfamily hydrolase involved in NAD metabolism|uniref:bis(5'-nucleosyl)-tetraphosphatase (symmetrical) YqeK n=1 Tax=Tuberibacillus calidus TaxID=340097 RepID=UPI00041FC49D|nr:bis(5'-nucleosyl)-tetraphosphatase (symmetrical) YqeK [Tuberibacillus calidus]